VELEPISNTPLTLRMTTTTDNVYKTIGKLAGINVLFDMDYKPQRITIELDEVPLRDALRMVALESKSSGAHLEQGESLSPPKAGAKSMKTT